MRNLYLQTGEKVLVHRGLSEPICPWAERTLPIARAGRDSLQRKRMPLFYAVRDTSGAVALCLHGIISLQVKGIGESNGVYEEDPSHPFYGWWCHVLQHQHHAVAQLGRPNRQYLGVHYQIPFPHHVSTRDWRKALSTAPDVFDELRSDLIPELFPHVHAFYDPFKVPFDSAMRSC